MAIRTIKTGFSLACVAALLVGCASTQEQATTSETPTQQPVVEEQVVEELGTVFYFDYDKSALKPEARAVLMAHAERLKEEGRNVRLEGHADERGTREYNMALGERRANAVRDFLILQGVNASLLETISYGEEQAVAYCHDESCWSQNRRVEMR